MVDALKVALLDFLRNKMKAKAKVNVINVVIIVPNVVLRKIAPNVKEDIK